MILPAALLLGNQLLTSVVDRVPVLNVEQVCRGIAEQGGSSFHDPAIAKQKKECIASEREVRTQLVKRWSSFRATDKRACTSESEMGGDSSYTELLTCLEMAHDVRTMHEHPDTSDMPDTNTSATGAVPSAGAGGLKENSTLLRNRLGHGLRQR